MKKKYFFIEMFKDQNDINEKSVVGFISFMMMVIAMGVDIVTGVTGKELLINQFIFYNFALCIFFFVFTKMIEY